MQEAKWFSDFCLEHLGRWLVGQEIELDFTCFKFDVFCFKRSFQWVTTKCIYVHHHLPSNLCFLGCSFGVEACTPERPFTQVYFRISRKLLVRNEDPPNEWKLCSTPVWEISLILEPLMAGVGMGCENTVRKQEDRGTKHRCSFKNGHKTRIKGVLF